MKLSDVLDWLSCPECALSDLALVIQKAVDQFNSKQEKVYLAVAVTAVEKAVDAAEEAKLETEGK